MAWSFAWPPPSQPCSKPWLLEPDPALNPPSTPSFFPNTCHQILHCYYIWTTSELHLSFQWNPISYLHYIPISNILTVLIGSTLFSLIFIWKMWGGPALLWFSVRWIAKCMFQIKNFRIQNNLCYRISNQTQVKELTERNLVQLGCDGTGALINSFDHFSNSAAKWQKMP